MIKGLFFDMGGTLYSYRNLGQLTHELLGEFSARHGLQQDARSLLQHYAAGNKKADHHFAHKSFYLFREYFERTYAEMLTLAELTHLQHDFPWFADRQTAVFTSKMILKENTHEVLGALRAKVPYMSIVSNVDEEQFHPLLNRADLPKWFDHCTSSESARSCKPDDGFFRVALEKSGLAPREVVFIGDSLEQDIAGAQKAGMHTVLISEDEGPAPMHVGKAHTVEPDFRITDLAELVGVVDELLARR
jgi:HAD superfamily hydrolase (TIGR01549 family)